MCELFENRIYFQQTRCKPAKFKKYVCHNTEEMCTRRIIVSLYFDSAGHSLSMVL